ncbi:helix-turn-helix domain-containing protein [Lactococcus sp. S64]|uniref:Rgg/GadR/MutR family transcriptional regulator n=1 Tax=Lactococcus sp. S64 TaxID=2767459 RepID=UPI001906BFF0|nr:Rgg/GadR/MutR family transcriptional regulator [Lactococcus sp. S64]MBK0084302.1 helix-turn-helix domain-containing protein [Lactococcus sp. S64]
MIYKKYGQIFKKIRKQRKISLSEFSAIGISKPTLSRFERSETMMSFDKVVQALQFMGISLEEYEYLLNDFYPNEPEILLRELEVATIKNDKKELNRLCKETTIDYPYIAISAKSRLIGLSQNEIETITSYLYDIKVWNLTELWILYFTMDYLNTKDILYLIDLFLSDTNKIFNSPKHLSILTQSCCQAVIILSSRGYKEYGEYILGKIDSFNLINSMNLRNLYNFSRGYWKYKFTDKEDGNRLMLNALDIFFSISTIDIANFYQKQYDSFI